jgi:hypothetical protein
LARLEPNLDRLTSYALPVDGTPEMVAYSWGRIWYAEDWAGTAGSLNLGAPGGVTAVLSRTTSSVVPACGALGPATTAPVTTTTGVAVWAAGTYTVAVDVDGWRIYQLPEDSTPWGIAVGAGRVLVADPSYQVLASLPEDPQVGEIVVRAQTEPPGAEQRFEFGTSYGASFALADGEEHRSGLLAPGTYTVTETAPEGWTLTGSTCTDGSDPAAIALGPGETVVCTFVNKPDEQRVYLPLVTR